MCKTANSFEPLLYLKGDHSKYKRCIALKLKIVDKYISDILFLFPFSNYQTFRLDGQGTHKDKIRSFRWGMGQKGLGLGKVSAFLNFEWSLIFGAPLTGSPSLASVHIFCPLSCLLPKLDTTRRLALSRGNLQHWPLERTTRRTRNPVAWDKGTWDHNRLQWVTGRIMEAKWIQVVNAISFEQNSYHHRLVANVKLRIASYQSRFVFWHQLLYGRHYFPVFWIRGPVH